MHDSNTSARAIAKLKGEKRYQGLPCPKGHTTRWVSNKSCVTCCSLIQAEQWEWRRLYQRHWRRLHPEDREAHSKRVNDWRWRKWAIADRAADERQAVQLSTLIALRDEGVRL